ncbi:MAG: hypothetical protein GX751_09510 [Desulfuromonadaceae bacterium]|nr:hypothetical protein [Desulfuromonadaceae bacterium]
MLIRIQRKNHKFDMVKPHLLDEYIQAGEIRSFNRSSGWAVIGRDPIRGNGRVPYIGPERRKA